MIFYAMLLHVNLRETPCVYSWIIVFALQCLVRRYTQLHALHHYTPYTYPTARLYNTFTINDENTDRSNIIMFISLIQQQHCNNHCVRYMVFSKRMQHRIHTRTLGVTSLLTNLVSFEFSTFPFFVNMTAHHCRVSRTYLFL